jgi:hypothetical protein
LFVFFFVVFFVALFFFVCFAHKINAAKRSPEPLLWPRKQER